MPTHRQRFEAKFDRRGDDECWNWKGASTKTGYGVFRFRGRNTTAHRASLEMSLGRNLEAGEEALHSCNNKSCVNPRHLRPGSHAENMADAKRDGLMVSGSSHPCSNATWLEIAHIESMLRMGVSGEEVARMTGRSTSFVSRVRHGNHWLQKAEKARRENLEFETHALSNTTTK